MVNHRVDRVLQFENFALRVRRDFARQIAIRHRRGHFGDISHLAGQIARHQIDVIGQIFPRSAHAPNLRLAAQFAFGADFASDAGHFRGERTELVNHRIDCVFQFADFALHINRDFLAQIAICDRRGDFGDIPHLASQITSHQIDVIGQIFPSSGHPFDPRLTAHFAFGADFAGHASHLRSERAKLIHHRIHDFGGAKEFTFKRPTFDIQRNCLA